MSISCLNTGLALILQQLSGFTVWLWNSGSRTWAGSIVRKSNLPVMMTSDDENLIFWNDTCSSTSPPLSQSHPKYLHAHTHVSQISNTCQLLYYMPPIIKITRGICYYNNFHLIWDHLFPHERICTCKAYRKSLKLHGFRLITSNIYIHSKM